jgi:RimJ/RimL family protein N-acetyltransferase
MESTSPQFGLVAESIDGAGVRIRRYADSDAADVQAGCDDPLTQRFLPMLPSPYTREDAIWWITEGSVVAFERGGGNFAVADPRTDRLLGGIGVTHEQNGSGEIGYWIAPWARQQGVATAATRALTDYAFASGYGRLHLRTEHENLASQRVAVAAGYAWEGVQRAAALGRSGARHDLIVWSRLPDDPPGPSPRLLPDLPGGQLSDGVVTLRPLGPADGAALHALHTVPDVAASEVPPLGTARTADQHPAGGADQPTAGTLVAATEAIRYSAWAGARWLAGARAHLTVRDSRTGIFAGDIALLGVNPVLGVGTVGYAIDPAWRGRGFATRAALLLCRWALHEVGLARLVAGTAPDNAASRRVLEKAGFTREGYQRGHHPTVDGGRADVVSYALLAADVRSRTDKSGVKGRS